MSEPQNVGTYRFGEAQTEMPRYKSHKEVHALKIKIIERESDGGACLHFEERGFAPIPVAKEWLVAKVTDSNDNGYLVVYSDGYRSWSPTKAFENGYTRVN